MKKVIFLFDLNSFFANAEKSRNEEYKDRDVIISPRNNHSIVTAASHGAKKKGVHVGMPYYKAKVVCPNGVYLHPDHSFYVSLSNSIFNFIKENYTTLVEVSSIDEAYIDVTEILINQPFNPEELARGLLDDIKKNFNVTASIGISNNRFLAKMASEFYKVDNYSTCFTNEIESKLWKLPIKKMYGVGSGVEKKLLNLGINTIGELANSKDDAQLTHNLKTSLMSYYDTLISWSNGISNNELSFDYIEAKSVSKQITLNEYLVDSVEVDRLLKKIVIIVSDNLERSSLAGKSIDLLIRYGKFETNHKSRTLKTYINTANDIYNESYDLLDDLWDYNRPIKGIRVTVSNITNFKTALRQDSIIDGEIIKGINKKELVNKINNKLGFEGVITTDDFKKNPKYRKKDSFKSHQIKFKSWD